MAHDSPPSLDAIQKAARAVGLTVMGGFAVNPDDAFPNGTKTALLLGPDGPQFWELFTRSPEYNDEAKDPIDRWSRREVGALADDLGAQALFPFGHTPPLPFIGWALRTGRAWVSEVNLLIHDDAGLWVSFRGCLALPYEVALPKAPERPCDTCIDRPCLSACPVSALTGAGYDIAACHDYLDTVAGQDCMQSGCAVRRACPISQSHGRVPEQSALHMRSFHP